MATWDGKGLRMLFRKPETNLATRKEWIEMLAQAVLGCKRKDGAGRGLRKEEFLGLVAGQYARKEEKIQGAVVATGKPRSFWMKEWTETNRRGEYDGLTVQYGTTGALIGGLFHKEIVELRKRLGW